MSFENMTVARIKGQVTDEQYRAYLNEQRAQHNLPPVHSQDSPDGHVAKPSEILTPHLNGPLLDPPVRCVLCGVIVKWSDVRWEA